MVTSVQLFSLDDLHESDLLFNSSQVPKQQQEDDSDDNKDNPVTKVITIEQRDEVQEHSDNRDHRHYDNNQASLEDMDLIDMFLDENPEEVFGLRDLEQHDEIDLFDHGLVDTDEEQIFVMEEAARQSPSLLVSLGSHFFSDEDEHIKQSVVNAKKMSPTIKGGFQSASGRGVLERPSEASIRKAIRLLETEGESQFTDSIFSTSCALPHQHQSIGFMTAKGAAMTAPSEVALKRAQELLLSSQQELNDLIGFTSASGKRISAPTRQAIEHAERALLSSQSDRAQAIVGFVSASGKTMKAPSEEAIQKAAAKLQQNQEGNAVHTPALKKSKVSKQLFIDNPINHTPNTVDGVAAPCFNPFESASSQRLLQMSSSKNRLFQQVKAELVANKPNQKVGKENGRPTAQNPKKSITIKHNTQFKTPSMKQQSPLPVFHTRNPVECHQEANLPPLLTNNHVPKCLSLPMFDFTVSESQSRYSLREYFDAVPRPDLDALPHIITRMDAQKALEYCDDADLRSLQARLIAIGANERLATIRWISNHVRWIVWKICSLIRSFATYPAAMLCHEEVYRQLCYRYEREVNQCQRSCLKKIIERDDVAAKFMILFIVKIDYDVISDSYSLHLSDGWYAVKAELEGDRWSLLVQKGLLYPGQKLGICGARLHSEDAMDILDYMQEETLTGERSRQDKNPDAANALSSSRLIVGYNNVKRVTWDRILGYQKNVCFCRPLRQIDPRGGLVPCVDVVVVRVYPMCWVERTSQGQRIIRPQRIHEQWLHRQNDTNALLVEQDVKNVSEFSRFLRVLLVDSYAPDQSMCQFTFWNVDERTLELCKSGARLEIFFSRPLNGSLTAPNFGNSGIASMCSLYSTKSTVIRLKQTISGNGNSISAIIDNLLRPIQEEDCLVPNQDYDFPIHTTFSIKYQSNKLWVCLHGKQLACLMVPERLYGLVSFINSSNNSIRVSFTAIVVKDVTFLYEDPRFGFPVFTLNDRSVITGSKEEFSLIDDTLVNKLHEQLFLILK